MEKLVQDSYIESLKENKNTFDILEKKISETSSKPCTNLYELRERSQSKKLKGDLFEKFCKLYLTATNKYTNVWLLNEVPIEILEKIKLKKVDMGIDIICNSNNDYYAFQAKFRQNNGKSRILSWTEVSTFYALCYNTGPWKNCYVITNCDSVKHAANGNKEKSICLQTFRNISNDMWIKMYSGYEYENKTSNILESNININELREPRLKRFS